jgi:hypothetical protein
MRNSIRRAFTVGPGRYRHSITIDAEKLTDFAGIMKNQFPLNLIHDPEISQRYFRFKYGKNGKLKKFSLFTHPLDMNSKQELISELKLAMQNYVPPSTENSNPPKVVDNEFKKIVVFLLFSPFIIYYIYLLFR